MASKKENAFISYLETWSKKLPPLSADVRERLVKLAPILALVFGILGVISMGVLGLLSPFFVFLGPRGASESILALCVGLLSSILLLCAYSGLKHRAYNGWRFLFWSQILSALSAVLHPYPDLFGVLIGLFGLYLIYQIKSFYK